jgi:hypothetical protein
MEISNFPVDVQELSITLMTKEKVLFKKNKIGLLKRKVLNTFVEQQRWNLYRHIETDDLPSYEKDEYDELDEEEKIKYLASAEKTKLCLKVYCSRKPSYFIWNAFFLIFLITSVALTHFVVEPRLAQNRLQLTATILLTSVSFKVS